MRAQSSVARNDKVDKDLVLAEREPNHACELPMTLSICHGTLQMNQGAPPIQQGIPLGNDRPSLSTPLHLVSTWHRGFCMSVGRTEVGNT